MKRSSWLFEYPATRLIVAATNKKASHEKRKEWWEKKKIEVMTKVRESGIEIHDSVAASYSNTKGGYGPRIEIDAGLQRDLNECQTKILEHHDLIKEYDGWLLILNAHPEAQLELDHDDFLFFFGV